MSKEAKDLVTKVLSKKPDDRPTAAEALNHEWFKKMMGDKKHFSQVWDEDHGNVLQNIKQFNGALKMQQAAMAFIQVNIITNKEKARMR